jgi:DNA repair exonuclease SbcCD nuclease subunit
MRFAHLADTHLGYRQYNLDEREADFYHTFHDAVDRIIKARCDFVIHSGDLFDSPRPPIKAMLEVMKAVDRLKKEGIKVFAIAGNHDLLLRRGAVPPQRLYRSIEFLTPQKPSRVYRGIYICGLPYHSRIHTKVLREKLHLLAEEASGHDRRILLLHQGIDKYFPLEHEIKIGDLPKDFDYYAMGHIHKRIIDTYGRRILAYPGSPEMWRMDELQDWRDNGKGFYIIKTPGFKINRIDLDIRPFVKAEVSSSEDIQPVKDRIHLQRRPVVRVTVSANPHEYNALYQELLRELKEALYLDIRRKQLEEKGEPEEKPISLKELLMEAMEGHSEDEKAFAYTLFEALSRGKLDSARSIVKDFYEKWTPSKKKNNHDQRQTNLEVYK